MKFIYKPFAIVVGLLAGMLEQEGLREGLGRNRR